MVSWPGFDREIEHLQRKYPRVFEDVRAAIASPTTRTDAVPGYAHRLFKMRIASRDLGRGSRGGFRLYLWVEYDTPPKPATVYPVTMYLKSERKDLPVEKLRRVLEQFLEWAPELQRSTHRKRE